MKSGERRYLEVNRELKITVKNENDYEHEI